MSFKLFCGIGILPDGSKIAEYDDQWLSEKLNELYLDYNIPEYRIYITLLQLIKDREISVHSHNVILFNMMKDEEAKEHIYFYSLKDKKIKKFFDNDTTLEKLTILNPGEVIADTFIREL